VKGSVPLKTTMLRFFSYVSVKSHNILMFSAQFSQLFDDFPYLRWCSHLSRRFSHFSRSFSQCFTSILPYKPPVFAACHPAPHVIPRTEPRTRPGQFRGVHATRGGKGPAPSTLATKPKWAVGLSEMVVLAWF
jgi:hypothetical protein